jgi:hypothetical protein
MPSLPNSLEISFDDIARIVTYQFESIDEIEYTIDERLDELAEDQTGDQYIVFQCVTAATFRALDRDDQSIPRMG